MACALKISEGSSMGMHAMGLLALEPGKPLSTKVIAQCFHVSEAHLAKIMQRLVKVGLLHSVRGPKGGFSLVKDPTTTTLLEVLQGVEQCDALRHRHGAFSRGNDLVESGTTLGRPSRGHGAQPKTHGHLSRVNDLDRARCFPLGTPLDR